MRYGQETVDRVRSMMAPGNPAPADSPVGHWHDRHGQETHDKILTQAQGHAADLLEAQPRPRPARRRPGSLRPPTGRAWRVIAPLGAGLAVAGLLTGLTLATSGPARRPAAGVAAAATKGMPRLYVTLDTRGDPGGFLAQVHASRTGQVLSWVRVPGYIASNPNITADRSDRAFVISSTSRGKGGTTGAATLYLLRVSANGRSLKLTSLPPIILLPPGSQNVIDGMAISADGTKLAVALQFYQNGSLLDQRGEIVVYSLPSGANETWTVSKDVSAPWNPAWTDGDRMLTFVWQDHLSGTPWFVTGRSQIRVLDTTAPAGNLLTYSKVLVAGGGRLGFIQAALAGPGNSPIIAALYQVPGSAKGTARMRLVSLSASGAITRVLAKEAVRYDGRRQEGQAVSSCQVLGIDATGRHVLAYCPRFGRIDNGTFTPLRHSSNAFAAAW